MPEAVTALTEVRQIYERHNGSELLVVGHTDTMGDPSFNDPLSLERAKATLAYLQDDVDTWLTFYETSVPEARRWGEAEDARMQELVNDPSLSRSELIAAYMALDGAELDANEFTINGTAHGCGENFPLDDSGEALDTKPSNAKEDALDRRVELFFSTPSSESYQNPPAKNSKKGSKQYPEWRKLAKLVSEGEVGGLPTREVQVQFLDPEDANFGDIAYRIETAEGTVIEGSSSDSSVHAFIRTKSTQARLIIDGHEMILELEG